MKGIDISRYDSDGDGYPLKKIPQKAFEESEFVIVKATQGTSYKHTAVFHEQMKAVIQHGKLAGAYHYAAGGDPKKEAAYFLDTVHDYIWKAVLCLDWEKNQNSAWGSRSWCKTFIDYVKAKTGVTCFLYTGLDGCKQNEGLSKKVPLWFAGYPTDNNSWNLPPFKYDLGAWKNCTIWQYTSSHEQCDRNTCYLTKKQWKAYAEGDWKKYTGKLPKMPPRGYYKEGDGITTLADWQGEIKKVQDAVNWATKGEDLVVDGKYGKKTRSAVEGLQKAHRLPVNGCYGEKCQKVIKSMKK